MRPRYYFVFLILAVLLPACGKKGGFTLAKSETARDFNECVALASKKKYEKAVQCFEGYKAKNYEYAAAAAADISIADAYLAKKDYVMATESYKIFIDAYPYHEKVPYAYYKAGVAALKQNSKKLGRDQTKIDEAHQLLETVVKFYGHSPYAEAAKTQYDEVRRLKARKSYQVGRFYYKYKEYLAAAPRFQTVVTEYPRLGLDEKSFYYLISSLRKTKQENLAGKYLEIFKKFYPQSPYVRKL